MSSLTKEQILEIIATAEYTVATTTIGADEVTTAIEQAGELANLGIRPKELVKQFELLQEERGTLKLAVLMQHGEPVYPFPLIAVSVDVVDKPSPMTIAVLYISPTPGDIGVFANDKLKMEISKHEGLVTAFDGSKAQHIKMYIHDCPPNVTIEIRTKTPPTEEQKLATLLVKEK